MKFLFVQQWICGSDANTGIASLLQRELIRKGHSVFVMGELVEPVSGNKSKPGVSPVVVIPLEDKKSRHMRAAYREMDSKLARGRSGLGILLRHPCALWATIVRRLFGYEIWGRIFGRHIAKLDKLQHFDVIVAITAPYYTAQAVAAVRTSAKKIVYMLDPFATSQVVDTPFRTRQELSVIRKITAVFTPPLVYIEYAQLPKFKPWMEKFLSAEFPLVCPERLHRPTSDILSEETSKSALLPSDRLNCLYAGYFYPQIRRPDFLFQLVESYPSDDILLTVLGGVYGAFEPGYMDTWKRRLGGRLVVYEPLSQDELDQLLPKADILVNLGNSIPNQLPSKLVEYISTGLPILNLHPLENCPSLPYLERYGLSLSLHSKGVPEPWQTVEFTDFCKEAQGKKVSERVIMKEFVQCTPGYVVNQLLQAIDL